MPSKVKKQLIVLYVLGALAIALFISGAAEAAAQKIYYFVNGKTPNSVERAEIVKLEALEGPAFEVRALNIKKVTRCPSGAAYISGNIPAVCRDGGIDSGTTLYTEADPDNPPRPNTLPTTQGIIYNGQIITIAGGGSYAFTVSGGVVTAVTYTAPDAGT